MNGILIPVLDKKRFEYSYLAAGSSQEVILVPAINLAEYDWAQLWVRVHERNMVAGAQRIRLELRSTLPSADDPREFITSGAGVLSVDVTSSTPTTVPGLLGSGGQSDAPAYFRLSASILQNSASSDRLYAELSAVLSLRCR